MGTTRRHFDFATIVTFFVIIFIAFSNIHKSCAAANSHELSYERAKKTLNEKLNADVYEPDIRPLNNQSESVKINVQFHLVSIIEINDVTQTFVCNGFLVLEWMDERIAWENSDNRSSLTRFSIKKQRVWTPKLYSLNTRDSREISNADDDMVLVFDDGDTFWMPGGVYQVQCITDITRFPFDKQTCVLTFVSLSNLLGDLKFWHDGPEEYSDVRLDFYYRNMEWDLKTARLTSGELSVRGSRYVPYISIEVTVKRRASMLVVNVIVPVVALSFINLLVFLIPANSGEKISYGITVLLSMFVFLGAVQSILPTTAEVLPHLIVYVNCLLGLSFLATAASIVIVLFHNENQAPVQGLVSQESTSRNYTTNMTDDNITESPQRLDKEDFQYQREQKYDESATVQNLHGFKLRAYLQSNMNKVSFMFFFLIWFILSITYLYILGSSHFD